MEASLKQFKENVARWASVCPEGADVVSATQCDKVSFYQSAEGKANLQYHDKDQEISYLYHSTEDPEKEAKFWFSELSLNGVHILYVYGVGLGYAYGAARQWLRADETHTLVFLEDNPQVIHRLLETAMGTRLLHDRQVFLFLFSEEVVFTKSSETYRGLDTIVMPFSLYPFIVSALECYAKHKRKTLTEVTALVAYFTNIIKLSTLEYSKSGLIFFNNFFRNSLDLPSCYVAENLFGKFKGIPAVICGAGPSLDKNIQSLAKLNDHAVIFAGGTALNALNARGISPHFGVGIDPNPDQFSRIIMNHAYETPFFYRSRLCHEAFELIHADKLFVGGTSGHEIGNWLQEKLEIGSNEVEEGHNVLNFSLSIAHAMGCNPILLVGIDLAYSEGRSYASGIVSHPIHDRKINFRTKGAGDALLMKNDIYGNPVQTLWKWVGESIWYSRFAENHPDIVIINATEGGIGFSGIENKTLEQAAALYLQPSFDLASRIHGEIQNSPLPLEAALPKIRTALNDLALSLKRCSEAYQKLETLEYSQQAASTGNDENFLKKIYEEEETICQEMGYRVVLKAFNDACMKFLGLELLRLKSEKEDLPVHQAIFKQVQLDARRHASLKETSYLNACLIDNLLKENSDLQSSIKFWIEKSEKTVLADLKNKYPLPSVDDPKAYHFDNGSISINDPELELYYSESLSDAADFRKASLYYPDGNLKAEQYYKGSVLHGPSSFYSQNKGLLASSWFLNGLREGKMRTYYSSGELHSLQQFRKGQWTGNQEYYYRNGRPKTILIYETGQLHGLVSLYHPSGLLARELRFLDGKRFGNERIWNERGQLLVEAQYLADRPVGIARKWYPNGILACEVVYDSISKKEVVKFWDINGTPQDLENQDQGDYFNLVKKQTGRLTSSLEQVVAEVSKTIPLVYTSMKTQFPEENIPLEHENAFLNDFKNDLHEVQKEMNRLHGLNEALKEKGENETEADEALWHDADSMKLLEQQLLMHKRDMDNGMQAIEDGLKHVLNEYLNQLDKIRKDREEKKE